MGTTNFGPKYSISNFWRKHRCVILIRGVDCWLPGLANWRCCSVKFLGNKDWGGDCSLFYGTRYKMYMNSVMMESVNACLELVELPTGALMLINLSPAACDAGKLERDNP